MVRVGCAGFSVPQTRYFEELLLLEVQETAVRVPGPGTIGRWKREAPDGFEWTLLAPREALERGAAALADLTRLARTLRAKAAILQVPPDLAPSRGSRKAVRSCVENLPRAGSLRWVVELPPGWSGRDRSALAAGLGVIVAVNPLEIRAPEGKTAYFRLPGPAGHRSRYEDDALARVQSASRGFADVYTIFANADMCADAIRFRRLVEE